MMPTREFRPGLAPEKFYYDTLTSGRAKATSCPFNPAGKHRTSLITTRINSAAT